MVTRYYSSIDWERELIALEIHCGGGKKEMGLNEMQA